MYPYLGYPYPCSGIGGYTGTGLKRTGHHFWEKNPGNPYPFTRQPEPVVPVYPLYPYPLFFFYFENSKFPPEKKQKKKQKICENRKKKLKNRGKKKNSARVYPYPGYPPPLPVVPATRDGFTRTRPVSPVSKPLI